MRKISAWPLLVLFAVFIWSHFASAAAVATGDASSETFVDPMAKLPAKAQQLPAKHPLRRAAQLPAKLPGKKTIVVLAGKNQQAETSVPTKKLAASKKRTVVVAAPSLPSKLPARTKVIMNFDQPSLPVSPSVVIREAPPTIDPNEQKEIERVTRHDIFEAPTFENQSARELKPALPDSDSYELLPRKQARPVVRETVLPTLPARPVEPTIVVHEVPRPAMPVAVSTPLPAPAPARVAESVAVSEPVGATDDDAEDPGEALSPLEEAAIRPQAPNQFTVEAPPQVHAPGAADEHALLPEPFDTKPQAPKYSPLTETEQAIDTEKGAFSEGYTVHSAPALKTTFLIPSGEIPHRRVFIRTGYLDAKYSRIEGDLKDGATVFGVSASQVFSKTEIRLGFDVAHGLDQEVSLRNTRMAMFRAEGLYTLYAHEIFQPYIGGAVGLADIDLTSYHTSSDSSQVTLVENAKGTALLVAPEVGTRLRVSHEISFDVTLQYLLFSGSSEISNLGGLLAEAALGFTF